MFNLETGCKADLIVRKGRPFSEVEFHRRAQVDLLGLQVWMVSPSCIAHPLIATCNAMLQAAFDYSRLD